MEQPQNSVDVEFDCSAIVEQVVARTNERNDIALENVNAALIKQQGQIEKLLQLFSSLPTEKDLNVPEGTRSFGRDNTTEVVPKTKICEDLNVPEGTRSVSGHNTAGAVCPGGGSLKSMDRQTDELSVQGSNGWFGDDVATEAPTENGEDLQPTIEEEAEYWQTVSSDYDCPEIAKGPEVGSSISSAGKVIWQKRLKDDALKQKLADAAIPSNCPYLVPKKIETPI